MKPTEKVTDSDYRKACFIINTITKYMPAKSRSTIAIIQNAEKIVMLYHLQNKGIKPATPIDKPANVIGMFLQHSKTYFEARAAVTRSRAK